MRKILSHFENAVNRSISENIPLETIYRLRSDNRFISIKASIARDEKGIPASDGRGLF